MPGPNDPDFREYLNRVAHSWSMNSTEDLLKVLWEDGKLPGILSDEKPFNLQRAEDAFYEYYLSFLHQAQGNLQEANRMGLIDPYIIEKEYPLEAEFVLNSQYYPGEYTALEEFFGSHNINTLGGLASLYSNIYSLFPRIVTDKDGEFSEAKDIAKSYLYLSALEKGQITPLALNFDPEQIRKNAVSFMYSDESYKEIDDILLRQTADLLYSDGVNICQGAPLDAEAIEEFLRTFLPDNYSTEDVVNLTNGAYRSYLENFSYEDTSNSLIYSRIHEQVAFNALFLTASEIDASRQELYLSNFFNDPETLGQLNGEISRMPEEIIGISVVPIKQAFERFYEYTFSFTQVPVLDAQTVAELENEWAHKATEADRNVDLAGDLLIASALLPLSFAFEPVDIASSIAEGDPYGILLSLIPGASGWIDDAIEEGSDIFRFWDDFYFYMDYPRLGTFHTLRPSTDIYSLADRAKEVRSAINIPYGKGGGNIAVAGYYDLDNNLIKTYLARSGNENKDDIFASLMEPYLRPNEEIIDLGNLDQTLDYITLPGAERRYMDSEAKVLEFFKGIINSDSSGVIRLYSERHPCDSCANKIEDFRKWLRETTGGKVTLEVTYSYIYKPKK